MSRTVYPPPRRFDELPPPDAVTTTPDDASPAAGSHRRVCTVTSAVAAALCRAVRGSRVAAGAIANAGIIVIERDCYRLKEARECTELRSRQRRGGKP